MEKLRYFGNKIHQYRYWIAFVAFLLGLTFNLHGSSVANWNNFGVRETVSGQQDSTTNQYSGDDHANPISVLKSWVSLQPKSDGTILGYPRMIRIDEWLVQTPFYISQANTGSKLVNQLYGYSGQNMVLSYNAPVKHISVIGKPFNWGFLFLGATKGLSWYWCFKVIGMLLLAYEFSLILTKRNKALSVIGSFWITFTPSVQWWFMQHLGDVVFYSLAILVLIHHFFKQDRQLNKLGICLLLVSSIVGFTLVIYPAFQVPFAYIILLFFLFELLGSIKEKRVKATDWWMMGGTALVSGGIIGWTLYQSLDALKATLGTLYPGQRQSFGGDFGIENLSNLFLTFFLPFKTPSFSNQVELSASFNLLILALLIIPLVIWRKQLKENVFAVAMGVYSLFLLLYTFVGVPKIIAKLTLFTYVPSNRSWQALSIIAVFMSLWLVSYLWSEKRKYSHFVPLVFSLMGLVFVGMTTLWSPERAAYMGKKYLLVVFLIYVLTSITMFIKRKVLFALVVVLAIAVSGMTINPLVTGLGVIEDKKLSVEIKKIVSGNPNKYWLSEGNLYNYPQMFGAKTINSVRFYPDKKLMRVLDPTNEMEQAWNRYSHMQIFLTSEKTKMEVPVPDVLNMQLNQSDLTKLKVGYIISFRDLTAEFGSNYKMIYGPDKDGNRIYQYQAQSKIEE